MPLVRKPGSNTRPPEDAALEVRNALTHGNSEQRWAAARAAAGTGDGVEVLAAALRSEGDPRVREAMFTSLIRAGSSESVDALIQLLRVNDAGLRTSALDALCAMRSLVRPRLPELLRDNDSDVRILSCEIARGLPNEDATALLCELLAREPEANVCAAAIEVLAEAGGPEAIPDLASCAARFPESGFLGFAIAIARDRILAQSTAPHD